MGRKRSGKCVFRRFVLQTCKNQGLFGKGLIATFQLSSAASLNLGQILILVVCSYRKRTAAKQLIEAYYFQLTDGCGNKACTNDCCASSPVFSMKDKDRNALALLSIQLFKNKAKLCENGRSKVAKLPGDENVSTTLNAPSTSTNNKSPDASLVRPVLPGPSTSRSPAVSPSGINVKIFPLSVNEALA